MLRFSANLSFLYPDRPLLDRFTAAAKDGFRGVEMAVPYQAPLGRLIEHVAEHRLEVALINLPAGDWDGGERGIGCHPDRVDEFRAGIETAIRYARALTCTRVNALAGIAPKGVASETLDRVFAANLAWAAPRLHDAGIRLLVEPINTRDIPGFHVATMAHADRILAAAGADNLWFQFDVYHQQVMTGDIIPTFARYRERIAHVQIADHPGRHEPGTGEINFTYVLAAMDRLGYSGWVGCEYRPEGDTSAGLTWIAALHRI